MELVAEGVDLRVAGHAVEMEDPFLAPFSDVERPRGNADAERVVRVVARIERDQRLALDGKQRRVVVIVALELREVEFRGSRRS